MAISHVPVLIVGGGPIGLALAADLGRRGVRALLVEQNEDKLGSPKMIVVSVRTMELCRGLGLAPKIRNWGFPLEYPLDSVFCTSLSGYELGRIKTPSLLHDVETPFSPERERPCPQTWFDPILKEHARSFPSIALSYRTKLESFVQDANGVVAELTDLTTGKRRSVRADYLVGCDGYTSTVRNLLGIEVRGNKHLDLSMSVYVRIKELRRYHAIGDAYRYVFVGKEGTWSALTTIDGHDLWRAQLIGSDEIDVRRHDLDSVMQRMVGKSIEYNIEDVSYWVRKMTVADRFADGRVFLAGDSAHAHPPNGGLGMNTGIQDAFDLGWKLAAMVDGWGGPGLLQTYDIERRPASSRAAGESLRNYARLVAHTQHSEIDDATPEGEKVRLELGRRLVQENESSWHPIGVHLGYTYDPSPIIEPDGSVNPPDDMIGYVPSARPGSRAPHVWLGPGFSTLDQFGVGFTLLDFGGADTSTIVAAAALRRLPIRIEQVSNAEAAALYERRLVLVRPDGHVAWRGDDLPTNVLDLVDRVRGAGVPFATRRAAIT